MSVCYDDVEFMPKMLKFICLDICIFVYLFICVLYYNIYLDIYNIFIFKNKFI